ncbi:hypothetical protein MTR67_044063 [Solanum verrucosum]|uniref:histone acetyltransferase n=1 Tax=Solanum verrucosum TaxID=315347 RepID=A0AAF0UPW3_SOLVR|nr:hypothetical protein MTR67_044063 [Solanum verrucosum]
MDALSSHLTAPGRSRSSQSPSPSHSASASATSSIHKRKMASDDHAPPFPSSFSDTRDGALTSNDDLESISARGGGADSDSEDDSEEVGDDDEEDYDASSMRNFTASRLETSVAMVPPGRNTKLKSDNSVKIESSEIAKEAGTGCSGNVAPPTATGSVSGAVVKDESMKNIFTDNLQTSGAYTAREESLKREEESGRLKFVCVSNDGVDEHMIWLVGLKNIFARQLPNMPKEYIVRLVMDREEVSWKPKMGEGVKSNRRGKEGVLRAIGEEEVNHKSVMVVRRNLVVGGITYRPYTRDAGFAGARQRVYSSVLMGFCSRSIPYHVVVTTQDGGPLEPSQGSRDPGPVARGILPALHGHHHVPSGVSWEGSPSWPASGRHHEHHHEPCCGREGLHEKGAMAHQKFGEIAFCAITADEQVKGYGTRLMNHLKQHARDVDGLTHFLTYADNNAVGYFVKQGFTKEIYLERERWQGYIKDYDGGILMECKIDPKLPYTDLSTMIRRQRQAIDEKIRELSNCHIVYPGIDFQKKEAGIPKKAIKVEDIPGLREAGWTPDQYGHSRFKTVNSLSDQKSLTAFMRSLLKIMHDHPDSWPFKEPVDARDVPDYYDIIKDPIDLKTMSKRVESELYYVTFDMFLADVRRMFANARTYNSPETIYYKCSTRQVLESHFSNKVQAGLQSSIKIQ